MLRRNLITGFRRNLITGYKYMMFAVSLGQPLGFVLCWGAHAMLSEEMENLNKISPKDMCMGTIKRTSKRIPKTDYMNQKNQVMSL